MNSEEIKNALNRYLNDKDRNLNKLYIMAEKLNCLKLLEAYMEV